MSESNREPSKVRRATREGTLRYAQRFMGDAGRHRAAAGHFRERQQIFLSSLGIGTYLGEANAATDEAYTKCIGLAVESGANVLDTAINYRFQRSEHSVGAALVALAEAGYAREEIVLCTKAGFLTPDGEMPADPSEYFQREFIETGILRAEEIAAGCHAMAPRFLEDQMRRSLRNLGVDCIDVFYLHNPETQLGEISRQEFLLRVRAAFEFLESAAAHGQIQFYGMATWNAFRQPETAKDFLSLGEMEGIAREVGGEEHHFRFVQLPFNLAMPQALLMQNQKLDGKPMTMMRAANQLEITLVASASLLQGNLTRKLPQAVREALGLPNDNLCALQFARSAPGIVTALVGMSQQEHVRANLKLVAEPPAKIDQFLKIFGSWESA